jgi:organic hydroperoxide reductase OsmC/OhrA
MSETTRHHAHVTWQGGKRDMRAHEIQLAVQRIDSSCAPDLGGDPEKADPEELFVASLSACHMLWFLDYSRRERLRVLSYEDYLEGIMDGTRFVAVTLRPRVSFASEVPGELLDQLHHRAHDACFIANSVSCEVTIDSASDEQA